MEKITSEVISRRRAPPLLGMAALALAVPTTVLTVLDAEAQTAGMERRQERRAGRHERRQERRQAAMSDVRSVAQAAMSGVRSGGRRRCELRLCNERR